MRKHIIFLLLALAVLAVSCDGIPDIPEMAREGIVLTLDTRGMTLTKANAGTRDGVDEFNENLLGSSVDVFFFTEGAADNEASVWHDNVAVNNKMLMIPVSISEISRIFGGTVSGSEATVLIVANYHGAQPIDHGNNYTKQQLKALALTRADWSKHPQDDFVMLSDETTITLEDASSSTPASGVVKMRRVAAKVSFRMTIADEIAVENYSYIDGNEERSIELWRPKTDAMTIYPQFFMKDAVLGGTPTAIPSDETSAKLYTGVDNPYFLVRTSEMVSRSRILFEKDDNGQYVMNPDGTYKTYVDDDVDVPIYDTYAEVLTEHDDVTNTDVIVGGKVKGPFYSYPASWDAGIQTEPFLKLIIPWQSGKDGRVKYYYYKIPFPMEAFESNNWYEITLDVQILGGEEQLPVPLEAKYHVEDWVAGSSGSTSAVSARYLSVPTTSFTLYNSETLEIPILSSHPCEIVSVTVDKPKHGTSTYKNTTVEFTNATSSTGGKWVLNSLEEIDLKHTLSNTMGRNLDCAPYTISFRVRHSDDPTHYYQDVTIVQYPAIYIEKSTGGNAFVDGYYSLVAYDENNPDNKPDQGAVLRTTSNFKHYYHYGYFSVDGGRRVTPYGNLSGVSNGNQANNTYNGPVTVPTSETDNTIIHVTAFSGNSDKYTYNGNEKTYIIGDPRIPFMSASQIPDKTIVPYLKPGGSNNQTTDWTTDQLNALMVGTDVDNIIAPVFMFASEWGRQGNGESGFNTVAKRCATYQEAGYPAGRWRLPTEAEVAFVANLQANGYIGTLFGGGRYWISNGSALSINGTNVNPEANGNSTRCVYDIWYWGDEANENTYLYDPRP